ncbi:MAG: ATP-dependent Clp protease ATP-binding subunit ClpA [Desulfatirhabdiaceae bacterium]
MISKELSQALGQAVQEARQRRHEYVSVEHILYAVLHDSLGVEIIENCGGNVANLINEVEAFFSEKMTRIPEDREYTLQQTVAFQRVIQRAVNHVRSAEKQKVDVSDILASIFLEKDSYAAYFLSEEGITRLAVLSYISHDVPPSLFSQGQTGIAKPEPSEKSKKPDPLALFTVDLNEKAAQGRIDPLIHREAEIERTIQILCRRRKNNPIYVGDPGVGKTAMAEGLALKIHEGNVPDIMKGVHIYSLDMGGVLAGTKFRGEFEQRLKGVIESLKQKENPILFIDEIHTVVGAGATSGGSMDASNILKPALAGGEIRCIGSTTYEEYKNHFQKDRALSRRFEKVEILEPSVSETVLILKGLKSQYEAHHQIVYTDSALQAAAELSAKHINDRYLPDKAIDVIDEAGAFIRLSEGRRRKRIRPNDIEKIVAKMARIPAIRVSSSDKTRLEHLEDGLKQVVFGQDAALAAVVTAIKRSRAGLAAPIRPVGSFLFTGPTGVGKTEAARQVANLLGVHFSRYDMSEYMEKHAVARLIGAPPGYIGFDQGGLLTEDIRKHPHSVLLLDEIEKAHPDVYNILLQVLDYATLTDNNGKKADFRNVIIIMSSNAGSREMTAAAIGFGIPTADSEDRGKKAVEKTFSPEFRNRLDAIVHFNALSLDIMERVVDKFLAELNQQLEPKHVVVSLSAQARSWLAEQGHDPQYGARPLGRLIQTCIKDSLSDEILFGRLQKGGRIKVAMENGVPKFEFDENG